MLLKAWNVASVKPGGKNVSDVDNINMSVQEGNQCELKILVTK